MELTEAGSDPTSFYLQRPELSLTLRELEDACFKRMQLLRDVETFFEVGDNPNEEREFPILLNDKNAGFFAVSKEIAPDPEIMNKLKKLASKKDRASHFMLKLFHCTNSDRHRWFVKNETLLFRARLEGYKGEKKANEFLKQSLGFNFTPLREYEIIVKEKVILREVYRVPLHFATHILEKATLAPRGGFVEVKGPFLSSIIAKIFEDLLEFSLANAQGCLQDIEEDERLSSLLKRLGNPASGSIPRSLESRSRLSLEKLELNTRHFPPCMKLLHSHLRKDHHLKHYGRLQFGLFLKAIGLSFEDSLKFWKNEFCQKMTPDKFHKEYEYNIRHSYGKVGKMVDYTASGCGKLAHMAQPSAQEHHGCPFRHSERSELSRILLSYGLGELDLGPIFEKAESHPQVACIRLFKATHEGVPDSATEHIGHFPAAFYEASRRQEQS